ncbi:DUF6457 domain-containing protein [Nakamurella leprariae]|uniref:DUF6457 domain-containing protein n=1 Tax=Nakamurella leprariae TaxID=2803911 RepID=A0A939BXY5_9ACTN|nr:DUF6457 domain-containing protein [Nakamurella leprariae]MBM9466495.1 hypothetical protein [Nakamurella leprariae]
MTAAQDWLAEAARALDVPDDAVPDDVRTALLDLTRQVAHGVERKAGPLTCYLIGVAVGRGADPRAAAALLAGLAPDPEEDAR